MLSHQERIAVVGIGCRLPPSTVGPDGFWSFLMAKGDAVRSIPPDRWDWRAFYDPDPAKPAKMHVAHGSFLDQPIESFDAAFFGIAPIEAAQVDPQQRLLLEVTWEALEDAGVNMWSLRGSPTGVFVGAFTVDNMIARTEPQAREAIGPQTALTCTHTVLSSRLAHFFDLRGPCMTMDTACSSSLVAVHQAVSALRLGECDLAVVGGVNRIFRPETYLMMSKGQFLAPDGRSKSFSANADGYGRGEGCGVVVLKRLEDALRDGERIYAVVDHAGVNQDGRTEGMALPSAIAQKQLIERVTGQAGIDPAAIDYVEAHGTGTAVGDPIEMTAIGEVLGQAPGRTTPCVVGAVKAGIGHLEGAAGVAGFIKAVLVAAHGVAPPQAWLDELNPAIDFEGLGLAVPVTPRVVGTDRRPRVVAVNSFGYGGTNAYAVLSELPITDVRDRPAAPPAAFFPPVGVVSAHTPAAAGSLAGSYAKLLRDTAPAETPGLLARIAARTSHQHRLVAIGGEQSVPDLLEIAATGGQHPDVVAGHVGGSQPTQPAFVFSGMGPQWWAMGRGLLTSNRSFRDHAERCDEIFRGLAGWSIVEEMLAPQASSRMEATDRAQPANFVLQTGLAAVLAELGITAGAAIGHSVGEVAAAYVAGVLDLEGALTVAFHRSRLQASTAGTGGILATELTESDALEIVERHGPAVAVAAVNGPSATTLAGDLAAIDAIACEVEDRGLFCRKLSVEVAYHSPAMDPILEDLRVALSGLQARPSDIPLYSTVREEHDGGPWPADYWPENVREPVTFASTTQRLLADGHRVLVEIGPHPVLSLYLHQITGGTRNTAVVPTLHRDKPDARAVLEAVVGLWTRGVRVDWEPVTGPASPGSVPPYPWQREAHWQESASVRRTRTGESGYRDVLHGALASSFPPAWEFDVSPTTMPWSRQHLVNGAAVFPAAGYLEVLVSHARRLHPALPAVVEEVVIDSPLVLPPHEDPVVRVAVADADVTVSARSRGDLEGWRRVCRGRISTGRYTDPKPVDLDLTREDPVDVDGLYERFRDLGLDYHGPFRAITRLTHHANGVSADLDASALPEGYTLFPPLLDAAIQGLLAVQPDDARRLFVPVAIERCIVLRSLPTKATVQARVRAHAADKLVADVDVREHDGAPVAMLRGVEVRVVATGSNDETRAWLDDVTFEPLWETVVESTHRDHARPGNWALVGRGRLVDEIAAFIGSELGQGRTSVAETIHGLDAATLQRVDAVAIELPLSGIADVAGELAETLALLQRIDQLPEGRRPDEVVLLTRGALAVRPHDTAENWCSAWVSGLRRVVANERSWLRLRHIDHDAARVEALVDALLNQDTDELALRDGTVRQPTIVRRMAHNRASSWWDIAPTRPAAQAANHHLVRTSPSVTGLVWAATDRRAPGPTDIELRVEAVGLNHKDLLKQLGLFTDAMADLTYIGRSLGMEQCVVVERVGDQVHGIMSGERYLAAIPDGFRRYVTVEAGEARLARVPDSWSNTQAAGQLVALATAHRAVAELGALEAGQLLVVHGAAGAVGLASLEVARACGARVIATASTPEKRALLRQQRAEAVFDSRSLDFVDHILAMTEGAGADVVLNTLSGDGLRANLRITAEGGRLVELGKRDTLNGGSLPLALLDRNISYISFDLDYFVKVHDQFRRLADRVLDLVDAGIYRAIPINEVSAAGVTDAFARLASSQHVGKIVVNLADDANLRCATDPFRDEPVRCDRAYLITGGTGGLGLEAARWLVARGARDLVLVSRSGYLTARGREIVSQLRADGATVQVDAVDVTDATAVSALMSRLSAETRTLGGIVHAAGVGHDLPFEALSADDVRMVLRPKLIGAHVLHEATRDCHLDFFVLASSVSAWTGTSGQTAYAAANAALDGFAQWRSRSTGPTTSIAFGPLADVGMAAATPQIERYVRALGFEPIAVDRLGAALDRAVGWGRPQLGLFDIDWLQWSLAEPRAAASPTFAPLVDAARGSMGRDATALRATLMALARGPRLELLARLVVNELALVLGADPDELDLDGPLDALGLDSLMLVEVQTRLNRALRTELSLMGLLSRTSIRDAAAGIDESLAEPTS